MGAAVVRWQPVLGAQGERSGLVGACAAGLLAQAGREVARIGDLRPQPDHETRRPSDLTTLVDRGVALVGGLTAQPGHETPWSGGLTARRDRATAWTDGLTTQPGHVTPQPGGLTELADCQSAQTHGAVLRRESAQASACWRRASTRQAHHEDSSHHVRPSGRSGCAQRRETSRHCGRYPLERSECLADRPVLTGLVCHLEVGHCAHPVVLHRPRGIR